MQNFLVDRKNWNQIDEDLIEKYSPEVAQSMEVALKKVDDFLNVHGEDYSWRRFELFESALSDGAATIFCGGPITALAWVPTPHDENVDQILAVNIMMEFDKKYYVYERNCDPNTIQFWNFGVLDNENALVTEPRLEFCLCLDLGYVTHMEWCPSGCYDVEKDCGSESSLQRMGLLAVASSDSFVHVFSVPKPSEVK